MGTYRDLKRAAELGSEEAIPLLKKAEEYYETHREM
jgi:hypothetical protein